MGLRTTLLAVCAIAASISEGSPVRAQPVMFDDLQGSVINASTVLSMTIKRDGHTVDVRVEQEMNITIGPGEELYLVNNNTAHTPRGVRKGPPLAANFTLDHPRETRSRGGGEGVWTFADGTLTFLRTYQGGASRIAYAFTRETGGLGCTSTLNFAKEQGVTGIVLNSAVDGLPMVILNARQLSSTCRLTQQHQSTK